MSGKSAILATLVLTTLLGQCSTTNDLGNRRDRLLSIANDLPDTIISFYPSFDQFSDYNPLTKSYPNCTLEGCGKPITFITRNDKTITINTVGTSYPSYRLSPSKQTLLIQDNYGAHIISKNNYLTFQNDPDFYQDRGGGVLDSGDAVALSHLGSIDIEGKSGFGSQIISFHNNKPSDYRQLIDGEVIQCNRNVFLISYGDEDKENPIKHSYQYDWQIKKFIDLNKSLDKENSSIHASNCISDQSFEYIRTELDTHIYGIWDIKNGFSDTKNIDIEPIRRPNGISYYSFSDGGFYYVNDESKIYFSNFTTGENKLLFSLKDQSIEIDMNQPWSVAAFGSRILIIGKSIHNLNRYAGSMIDIKPKTIEANKYIPQLDSIYGSDVIDDIRVSDPDALFEWFSALPDNKP